LFADRTIDSKIIKGENFLRHFFRFLAPAVGNDCQWVLCYRASDHGWSAWSFHNRCDEKNNTVTIIQNFEYMFGGYTDIPWGEIDLSFKLNHLKYAATTATPLKTSFETTPT